MWSIGRKADAADNRIAVEATVSAGSGIVLPRLLRRPARRIARLLASGAVFSPRAMALVIGVVAGGGGAVWAMETGMGQRLVAQATSFAGFRIATIDITGNEQVSRIDVLTRIDLGAERSLFSFDAYKARQDLKSLPWVAEARVSKSYPDRLVVAITERKPFAVWQNNGELWLMERDGAAIVPFEERFAALPHVVGAGAGPKAAGFVTMVARQPQIAAHVLAYVLVGDRRWDLVLDTGVTVMLPEFGEEAELAELARLEREQGILSRDVTEIDMRLTDRMVLRLAPDAAARRLQVIGENQKGRKT